MPSSEEMVPVSLRMPASAVARLKKVTGMPFSTLGRLVLMRLLLNAEQQAAADGATQEDKVVAEIDAAIEKELPSGD